MSIPSHWDIAHVCEERESYIFERWGLAGPPLELARSIPEV